uniref:Uncharacterized protein n=1 Tax=Rhizophora mucronata TaxID=61149 RepID=A0A2P2PZF0_RHIMU
MCKLIGGPINKMMGKCG